MIKDVVAAPMEPFTPEEEQALFDKLDLLSIPALEEYIGSARTSLANKALAPTWRPRVELALKRAEQALQKGEAAAAVLAAQTPAPTPVVAAVPKAKRAPASAAPA
jgi:hypothetical protein